MRREHSLDVIRGLMLVIIAIDHFGGPVAALTWQTFGFVSAAEGFIFLSGLVYGRVYAEKYAPKGFGTLFNQSFARTRKIYRYHQSAFWIAVFFMLSLGVVKEEAIQVVQLLESNPVKGISMAFLLLLQPSWMEVLPMYVLFVFTAPFVLFAIEKGYAKLVLGLSLGVWLVDQFDVLWWSHAENYLDGLGVILGDRHLSSWQVLFVIGTWLGYKWFKNESIVNLENQTYLYTVLSLAVCLMLYRHFGDIGDVKGGWRLVSRDHLGPLRFFNFLLLLYLFSYLVHCRWIPNIRWLSFLGKYSLQVFSFQSAMLYLVSPFREYIASAGFTVEIVATLLFAATLTLPAWGQQIRDRRLRLKKTQGTSE